MFQRILVPFDFSPSSKAGFQFALRVADEAAHVHLVHVVDEAVPLPYAGAVQIGSLLTSAQEALAKVAAEPHGNVKLTHSVRSGWVWHSLLEEARTMHADAIVIGSHGRRGAMRFLLGSVAERLLKESEIPVVVVKEGPVGSGALRRVGLATDLTLASSPATETAREIARRNDATLEVIHVFEEPTDLPLASEMPQAQILESVEKLRRFRQERLGKLIADLMQVGIHVRESFPRGDAPERLALLAREHELDLLIMGTHARTGLEKFFSGSVAAHTVRLCGVPVLVVREHVQQMAAR